MAEYRDREHFIPVRKSDLVELLCREPALATRDREVFRRLCRRLDATLHCEYHERLEELKDAYALFDPDSDTEPLTEADAGERRRQMDRLFERFIALLERANFKRLSHGDVEAALEAASDWGLNLDVDFDVFDRLEIFARGDTIGRRTRRRWRNRRRLEEVAIPVYRRLVVILRLKDSERNHLVDTDSVYIKIFKDIPKLDLEMLLPGTRVKLSMKDRGKIVLPTLGGVAMTGWKILQGALPAVLSGAYNSLAFLGLVGGTAGYGLRSFYGYLQTKQKYQLNLTQSLYFQNLDNNAGALIRLLNEAEEQEFREAVLAYYFLLTQADKGGWNRERLDDAIEDFLEQSAGVKVDFEIGDAIEKLVRFDLVQQGSDGRMRAVPLADALAALGRVWQNSFDDFASREPILHMHTHLKTRRSQTTTL